MKYVEASTFGGPDVLTVIGKETPRSREVMLLVELQADGVNYPDVIAHAGLYPAITKAPFALGFEGAGVAREVEKGGSHPCGRKIRLACCASRCDSDAYTVLSGSVRS